VKSRIQNDGTQAVMDYLHRLCRERVSEVGNAFNWKTWYEYRDLTDKSVFFHVFV
jgi:hypothetical protein